MSAARETMLMLIEESAKHEILSPEWIIIENAISSLNKAIKLIEPEDDHEKAISAPATQDQSKDA